MLVSFQGQAKIADHMKKSYSLGDLSSDNPLIDYGDGVVDRIDEEDDELVNRLMEDRYNHELQELSRDHTDGRMTRRALPHRNQKSHEAGYFSIIHFFNLPFQAGGIAISMGHADRRVWKPYILKTTYQ